MQINDVFTQVEAQPSANCYMEVARVSGDGAFLGGAIGPGLPSLSAGLRERASALPAWEGEEPAGSLPRSTREAVSMGIVTGFVSAIPVGLIMAFFLWSTGFEFGEESIAFYSVLNTVPLGGFMGLIGGVTAYIAQKVLRM